MQWKRAIGTLLALVGFSDNIYSYLTPLTPAGAAFDGALIFIGAALIFMHKGKTG